MDKLGPRIALIAATLLLGSGAAARAASKPASALRLEITPSRLTLDGAGERGRAFVTAVKADGTRVDVTDRARFQLSAPVATVLGEGRIAAARNGRAQLVAAFAGARAVVPVEVRDAGQPRRLSFQYDVLPVLSRAGCNQGACHGNSEGKGGFKLSLKGEDPDTDWSTIVTAGHGRRVNPADPGASLLLLKAVSAMPHAGGMRFRQDSEEFRTLAAWIASGAPNDTPDAPRLTALDVSPRQQVLVLPAGMVRLSVTGRFSDGTARDLTEKAIYNCGDPALQVEADGKVSAERFADATVLVRFADAMQQTRLTFVPARKDFAWKPIPAGNWIDELQFARLRTLRLMPSALSSDSEFLRRAYLDAIGTLPTPEEVRAFLTDKSQVKRAKLIDGLLQRPEFDDFWTLKWSDVLRIEERTLDPKGVVAYRDWIKNAVHSDMPLDEMARTLLTATGSTYSNPPANYYRRTRDPIELAETTAQIFMGTRMLCAKCHNHPFERWKQEDYYALASCFAKVDRKIQNVERKDKFDLHELIGEETISVAQKGEVDNPRTRKAVAARLPLTTQPLAGVEAADPRVAFAKWLTGPENPYFARALVNRIWYHLNGKGIVDPVDDLRDSNPASNPELLDRLAREFAQHKYSLRYVVRTVMNSRTYQLSSLPNKTNEDDDRFFSRAVASRIPAEVLIDAISQATGAAGSFEGFPEGTRAIQLYAKKRKDPFLRTFGQPQRESVCECERGNDTTLAQSFTLISGGVMDGKLKKPDNRIGKLVQAGKPDGEIVTELYLATVSREPTSGERERAVQYVAGKKDRREALEDVLWALLNSKEFLLRR